jgi:hypothetical protein
MLMRNFHSVLTESSYSFKRLERTLCEQNKAVLVTQKNFAALLSTAESSKDYIACYTNSVENIDVNDPC